jgi:DNA-binding HxlR family transcriptional regulator
MPESVIKPRPVVDVEKVRALGHKDRMKIIGILHNEGKRSWSNLLTELDVNPNSLNFHLTKLVYSGLVGRKVVENDRRHPSTEYALTEEGKQMYLQLAGNK